MKVFMTTSEKEIFLANYKSVMAHQAATAEDKEWATTCKKLKNLYGMKYLIERLNGKA